MNVFKYTKQINNTGLRVMSPSLHQSCIIIILFTSYKSHIVSIVFPVEMSKASSLVTLMALLSTIFLGWDTFDNVSLSKNLEVLMLKQYKIVKNVSIISGTQCAKKRGSFYPLFPCRNR